jgi:hypothetical protein
MGENWFSEILHELIYKLMKVVNSLLISLKPRKW